jgi:hypothetical protein
MAEFVPNRVEESGEEDIQDITKDINELAQKYIVPIDKIRSIAKTTVASGNSDDGFTGLEPQTRWAESRPHAFLRYVGFPVVAGSKDPNKFYNPGFEPKFLRSLSGRAVLKQDVLSSFNNDVVLTSMSHNREQDAIDLGNVFVLRELSSSVYTLLLRHVRNFKMFDATDAFADYPQSFEHDDRKNEANKFFNENGSSFGGIGGWLVGQVRQLEVANTFAYTPIGISFAGIRHILHPFVVNPRIDNTVIPSSNRMAVPFLPDKDSLQLDKDVFVLRPGIELIIRERLRDSTNTAKTFFENIEKMLSNNVPDTIRTENELRLTAEALLDDNKISQSTINSDIKGITGVQVRNILELVKTIRSIIWSLHKAIETIDMARAKINWVPVPSKDGPEQGANGAVLNENAKFSGQLNVDRRIASLEIQKLNMKRRVTEDHELGEFASPFDGSINDESIEKKNQSLQELISQRDGIANDAFKAMADIEIISGEVSGLGLLDILAIYTALWSMEEKALISMLDDEAFDRLVTHFPSLKKGAAEARALTGEKYSIRDALDKFEKKLVNIFSFIDREINRQNVTPGEESSGSVSADS